MDERVAELEAMRQELEAQTDDEYLGKQKRLRGLD